jgi:uncharacterized protein YndB with AHSA1/START domain
MDLTRFRTSASILIGTSTAQVYDFIADMPRMGEISPECTGGTWASDARGVGAIFIGSNTAGERSWQRRIRVAVAEAPLEFAWENLGDPAATSDDDPGAARWGYTFTPDDGGTTVVETWALLDNPRLQSLGEEVLTGLQARMHAGIEQTLANLKQLLET